VVQAWRAARLSRQVLQQCQASARVTCGRRRGGQTGRCTHQGHSLQPRVCWGLRRLRAQVLETNRRVQAQNNAPPDFPAFVRQGYDIKVLADGYSVDSKGLIYKVRLGAAARRADRTP
jgi:hypothetical protein